MDQTMNGSLLYHEQLLVQAILLKGSNYQVLRTVTYTSARARSIVFPPNYAQVSCSSRSDARFHAPPLKKDPDSISFLQPKLQQDILPGLSSLSWLYPTRIPNNAIRCRRRPREDYLSLVTYFHSTNVFPLIETCPR